MSAETSQPDPKWLLLQRAVHFDVISVDTLRRSISSGDLPAARYGARLIRVRVRDLERSSDRSPQSGLSRRPTDGALMRPKGLRGP